LGKIGLILAEHLAKTMQARLVLVGRSCPRPREQWEEWLQGHGEEDVISRKIRRLQAVEQLGAELLVQAADVAEEAQLKEVFVQAEQRFGAIHGIIHAAGVPEAVTISELTPELCGKQFRPKVYGLYALAKAVQGRQLDFCYLVSSLSSVLGGLGFGAYAAANLFMDAFAQQQNRRSDFPWISVNWDGWHFNGEATSRIDTPDQAIKLISPRNGAEVFKKTFFVKVETPLIISTEPLQDKLSKWVYFAAQGEMKLEGSLAPHKRPSISAKYRAPTNKVENILCEIWQEFLGLEKIGIHDSFFELGGHSLLATQIALRARKSLGVELPLRTVFDSPTIAGLASAIASRGERRERAEPVNLLKQLELLSEEDVEAELNKRIMRQ
jgi:acyl carrier protein